MDSIKVDSFIGIDSDSQLNKDKIKAILYDISISISNYDLHNSHSYYFDIQEIYIPEKNIYLNLYGDLNIFSKDNMSDIRHEKGQNKKFIYLSKDLFYHILNIIELTKCINRTKYYLNYNFNSELDEIFNNN